MHFIGEVGGVCSTFLYFIVVPTVDDTSAGYIDANVSKQRARQSRSYIICFILTPQKQNNGQRVCMFAI